MTKPFEAIIFSAVSAVALGTVAHVTAGKLDVSEAIKGHRAAIAGGIAGAFLGKIFFEKQVENVATSYVQKIENERKQQAQQNRSL